MLMSKYKVIGLMSGSSLDGLDIAYCVFEKADDGWKFSIVHADCIPYSEEWTCRLQTARELDGRSLWRLHTDYGRLLSDLVNGFIAKYKLAGHVDLIASHGHTVFHFPGEHFTTQIGDGAALAAGTGIQVACDFRSSDIALGGQGTPIVPIGDLLLFKEYNYLLNLGGIANLTVKNGDKIIAFDICAANQVLNYYATQKGLKYDKDGALAASGQMCRPLLDKLDKLEYYQRPYPKSLDNSYSREAIIPLVDSFGISTEDKLHTYCEHIAHQINFHIEKAHAAKQGSLFITGGGAFNTYLTSTIKAHSSLPVHIPSDEIVKYKEALVMAFIGLLRWRREPNVLGTVTGATRDSIGGALYHP
jgi:anhydro-N-acetylmuramic acid kinase